MFSNNFKFYPDIDDKDFNKKIYKKREFFINKTKKIKKIDNIDKLTEKLCKFNLSSNQKFLKAYLSSKTPYNGILLFHGTGVGKTCSSISISENFKEFLLYNNKKVNVLLNPSIQDNFKKNIFNIERVKEGKPDQQCTKTSLLKDANIKKIDNYDVTNKKIQKIINSRYKFYGYIEFANTIKKIKKFSKKIYENKIKELFSESVMIIDEVHNIKENKSKDSKMLPVYLKEVLSIAENMKLILLSATPMSDKADEIIFILNLLLLNDKREPINEKGLFSKDGSITDKGIKILVEKSRGYISYLRGEHPIKFPKRFYPDSYNNKQLIKKFPELDISNKKLAKDEQISRLNIIGCEMTGKQLEMYKTMDLKGTDEDYGSFNITGLMASNIVYPSNIKNNIKNIIGDTGLKNIVEKKKGKYNIVDSKYEDFFVKENIKEYSTKIYNILKNIENKEGIIFIYSRFLGSGIIPLAIALEMNGYTNFNGSLINKKEPNKEPKYILITGDNELSKNTYSKYLKIENKNKNGEKVKIIIGSETASEGLDFKYIREVHILEPWFHFNKLEQVIGRAIRNCSHIALPFNKRNVMVYLYASIYDSPKESIDLKMYRLSEKKMKHIAQIEYLLKIHSVDCNLNIEANRFIDDIYIKKHEMILPNGKKIMASLNDQDNSKLCNFNKCDYKCVPDMKDGSINSIDNNTLNYNIIKDNIYDIQVLIKMLFKKQFVYSIDQIKTEFVKKYNNSNLNLLYYALHKMIKTNEEIIDVYGNIGVLKKTGTNYIVRPLYLHNQFTSLNNLRKPLTKKRHYLDITNSYVNQIKKTKRIGSDINKFIKDTDIINKRIENLITDSKYDNKDIKKLLEIFQEINKYPNKDISYNYLDIDKKEILLKILVKKQSTNSLNDLEKQVLYNIDSNILYIKRDIDNMYSNNKDIYGYKIVEGEDKVKYIKYNKKTDRFVNAPGDDIKLITKNINKTIRNEKQMNNIIGYLVNKKGNTISLKIREKTDSIKLTQIKTGSVCGNEGMKKDKIIFYIKEVLNINTYKSSKGLPGKKSLCNELELYLLYSEIKKTNNRRWYYTAEEAIERNLNKKLIN